MDCEIILTKAIREKKLIKITYKDEVRKVEPYLYGISSADKYLLRGYQTKNLSDHLSNPGWRLFDEENIEDIEILNETFIIRKEYNKDDEAFDDIICRI